MLPDEGLQLRDPLFQLLDAPLQGGLLAGFSMTPGAGRGASPLAAEGTLHATEERAKDSSFEDSGEGIIRHFPP